MSLTRRLEPSYRSKPSDDATVTPVAQPQRAYPPEPARQRRLLIRLTRPLIILGKVRPHYFTPTKGHPQFLKLTPGTWCMAVSRSQPVWRIGS